MGEGHGALDRLADRAGIALSYHNLQGIPQFIDDDGKRALLAAMGLSAETDGDIADALARLDDEDSRPLPHVVVTTPGTTVTVPVRLDSGDGGPVAWTIRTEGGETLTGVAAPAGPDAITLDLASSGPLPAGYHALSLDLGNGIATTSLIAAPRHAFGLADLGIDKRLWGISAPLYGLRSARNWGIGDFADLEALVENAAAVGAALVGINPVHALFRSQPSRFSPYSPSSRLYLNPLHLALDDLPGGSGSNPPPDIDVLRATAMVDYTQVATRKLGWLEAHYRRFTAASASNDDLMAAFQEFQRIEGQNLHRFALFEALSESVGRPGGARWQDWPSAYRDPASPAVAAFAQDHADRIGFAKFLQWLCDRQMAKVGDRARRTGMPVGLYSDLAVGVTPDSADVWADQASYGRGASLGAPPDQFSPAGQEWGLAPPLPRALTAAAYAPFIAVLRRAMRHAGALRIDHALGLERCFWAPEGGAAAGSYVRYPCSDLLAIIRLESHRNRCVVIGEDLGNVPQGLRDALTQSGLLGYRVFAFEREHDGAFRAAAEYPTACLAAAATHDLPTCKGHWAGRDIDWRVRIGQFDSDDQTAQARAERIETNREILRLLASEALLPDGVDPEDPPADMPDEVLHAIHQFLARTPSAIAIVQYEDMLGEIEQPNLPGTVNEHPNWRRRPGPPLESLSGHAGWQRLAEIMRQERAGEVR